MLSLCSNHTRNSVWWLFLACFLCLMPISCDKKSTEPPQPRDKWVPSSTGLENLFVEFLAVHTIDSDIIFAGTFEGLYKSTNGAETWARMDSGWSNAWVTAIAFDALDAEVMYVGTKGGGIWKSEDGGHSWEERSEVSLDPTIYSIATDPNHTDTLFVGTEGGVFRSFDSADTLTNVGLILRAFLAINPQNSKLVYAGGKWNGLYKSDDGGDEWFQSSEGIPPRDGSSRIQWILIDPVDTSILYASSIRDGIYKSTDAAGFWTSANQGLSNYDVRVIALDFSNTDLLYAATDQGVYRSDNAAGTWENMNKGLTNLNVKALAVDPLRPHILYAGTWAEGVFKWIGQ